MNKGLILVLVLVVLVLISALQTVQLIGLKDKIGSGTLNMGTRSGSEAQITTSGSHSSGGSSLDNLPSMVGGC